jgi:hypothetical protein
MSRVLRTVVRDCLYVNWAFPVDTLPALPEPLRYEEKLQDGIRYGFVSALLFRHEHLHLAGLPFLRLSYPQFNLRLYVRDHEGVPSVFFQRILVPGWVVPSARWVAHQPAQAAQFSYPRPFVDDNDGQWRWQVVREEALCVSATKAPPQTYSGPALGSWGKTVDFFRQRFRGYVLSSGELQPVETSQQSVQLWPLQASVEDPKLLMDSLKAGELSTWCRPHSAWLCPEVPYEFELSAETVRLSLTRTASPAAADPAMFQSSPSAARRSAA